MQRKCVMLLVVLFVLAAAVSGQQLMLHPINLSLCNNFSENVIKLRTDVFILQTHQHESCFLTNTTAPVLFRVTNTIPENASSPVVFVARSQNYVQTWQLPLILPEPSWKFHSVERTLCSFPPLSLSEWGQEEGEVIIDVFTSSTSGENYTIEVNPVEDAVLSLNKSAQLEVSFNSPSVRYFKFPENTSMVQVHVQAWSNMKNMCFIVSVQKAACPVDMIPQHGIPKQGAYQTMLNKTTLPVIKDLIGKEDFFIVVMLTKSSSCSDPKIKYTNESYEKQYNVTILITELKEAVQYPVDIALPVIVIVPLSFIVGLLFCVPLPSFILKGRILLKWRCEKCNRFCCQCVANGETESLLQRSSSIQESSPMRRPGDSSGNQPKDSPLEDSLSKKPDCEIRLKDLFKTSKETLEAQYKVYGWNAVTVGIFYGLPAIQFVLIQQLIFYTTGYEDLCYYNFDCAHPLEISIPSLGSSPLILIAFNNVWSNIGYVLLGGTFLVIAGIRNYWDYIRKKKLKDSKKFWSHGVPQFYGLYYAMGFALILEGFMSSFYHVCPSRFNFQFDTAFMFIIGGILTVKILQARHPDINANAFLTFYCFAVVILLTMIGIYESNKLSIRIILLALVMIFVVIFCISFYYFHDWRIEKLFNYVRTMTKDYRQECGKVWKWIKNTFTCCPCKRPIRLLRLTFVAVVNLIVVIVMGKIKCDVPTIVLGLFVANFFSFLLCYLVFKVWFKEPLTPAALINFLLLVGFWIAAILYFIKNITDKTITPAESRDNNEKCLGSGFYDDHDVWHFLSACAMFFSFLFIMTLDDGLRNKSTGEIYVF